MKRRTIFEIPIYGGAVVLTTTRKGLRNACASYSLIAPEDICLGICLPAECPDTGARLYVVGWFDGALSTLVHEFGHLTHFILMNAGIDPRDSNAETFCYLQDHLLQCAGLDRMKK